MAGNLYARLREGFAETLDAPAFVAADGSVLAWREIDELSARFAALLRARGVAPGDRVVAQVEKSVGAVALYLGCLRSGAIYVPINTAYTEAEVRYFVGNAEPRLFVAGTETRPPKDAAVTVLELGRDASSPLWSEALASAPLHDIEARDDDGVAAIVYTSGTTGVSKGAMLTHRNLASNAATLVSLWSFRRDDVLLHALPVYHVHGLFVALHCAMLSGAATLFLPKFDAAEVRSLLPRASVMMGVPTFYTRLLALEGFGRSDCTSMRLFISGSAPLLAETHRDFEQRTGQRILERYGMTETGMITSNPLVGERVAGTVGFALPDLRVRIAREDGAAAGSGEVGVLEVSGPNVFPGYWRLPEKTAEDFRPDGFFVTGDLARMDAEGRVTLVGRAKDLIISGGLNIYPKEIEELLDAVDGVAESAVVGVPDADFGEAVLAVVALEPGATLDRETLLAALAGRLARFKHPRRIELVAELPRNAMGKVQKKLLRERYAQAETAPRA